MAKFFTNFTSKSTASILAILWSLFAFVLIFLILTQNITAKDEINTMVLALLGSNISTVLGYYFGSSVDKKTIPSDDSKPEEVI